MHHRLIIDEPSKIMLRVSEEEFQKLEILPAFLDSDGNAVVSRYGFNSIRRRIGIMRSGLTQREINILEDAVTEE